MLPRALKRLLVTAAVLAAVAVAVGAAVGLIEAYEKRRAADDEGCRTYEAVRVVVLAVEKYVRKNQKWPGSWKEIEAMAVPRKSGGKEPSFAWPDDAAEIRRRVYVRFRRPLSRIVEDGPNFFDAVQPSSYYDFYKYADMDEKGQLWETMLDAYERQKSK